MTFYQPTQPSYPPLMPMQQGYQPLMPVQQGYFPTSYFQAAPAISGTPNLIGIPINRPTALQGPEQTTAPEVGLKMASIDWVQPKPFTVEEIQALQHAKRESCPPGTEIGLPNPVCQSCGRPVSADKLAQFEAGIKTGQDPGVLLDELGISGHCRLEYLKQPQIARGVWLLPEEKQAGYSINVTPANVVIETSQRPIRPTAISPELAKYWENEGALATEGTVAPVLTPARTTSKGVIIPAIRPRRVIKLTGQQQRLGPTKMVP